MEKILLWGTGKIAEEVLTQCQTLDIYYIVGIIDNNLKRIGTCFLGYSVYAPNEIRNICPDKIVILTDAYDEIVKQISIEYPEFGECVENKNFFYKQSLLKRYKAIDDPEIKKIISHIENNGLSIFNYPFCDKYKNFTCQVYYDTSHEMYYVIHCGKKMYFSRRYSSETEVINYYKSILLEQDEKSPHKYLSTEFDISDGDVVIDAGVAEGNFALEIIDKVSKIYLIEADSEWIEALNVTFEDYMDKVVIIKAFVSSYDEGDFRTLDSIISEKVNFIKMDIEGNEWDGLKGAQRIINNSSNLRLAICSYHSDFDQVLIESFMDEMSIEHTHTNGYMWFPLTIRQNYVSTSLNRAIIRGIKR